MHLKRGNLIIFKFVYFLVVNNSKYSQCVVDNIILGISVLDYPMGSCVPDTECYSSLNRIRSPVLLETVLISAGVLITGFHCIYTLSMNFYNR